MAFSDELSLNYSMSQLSANQEKEVQALEPPKLAISKSVIKKMGSQLSRASTEISSLVHMFEIFSLFRKSTEKTP